MPDAPTPLLTLLEAHRLLPAVNLTDASIGPMVARALRDAGLPLMEVTLRHPEALEAIRRLNAEVPDITCGAGTVLSGAQIEAAMDAGATFGVTPGFNPETVRAARSLGFPLLPGVQTAGEMEQALTLGCPVVKFFPASLAGGRSFLDALTGPYAGSGLRVVPFGGVGADNLATWFSNPLVIAVGGSWLTPRQALAAPARGGAAVIAESVAKARRILAALSQPSPNT